MDSLYNVALLRRAISCDPAAMLMVVQNYNVQGKIDDDDYIKMLGQINREIAGAEELLEEYESQQKSNEEFKKHIEVIRHRLLEVQRDAALGVVSKDFVDQYIDKIFVTPEPDGAIRLDIRIYTGGYHSKIPGQADNPHRPDGGQYRRGRGQRGHNKRVCC